jgi:hypothetical protein
LLFALYKAKSGMQVEAIKFSRHVIFCCTKSAPRFSLPGDFCN